VDAAVDAVQLGIPAMALFPKTPIHLKSESAEESCNQNNLVCRALRAIRDRVGDSLGLLADVALDPYTSHGHDGLMVD
ncbi:MAG: porphobilinogen synthase, partial [Pirellulaceae bacterium]